MVRVAVRAVSSQVTLIGLGGTLEAALLAIWGTRPGVVLLELTLPDSDGTASVDAFV